MSINPIRGPYAGGIRPEAPSPVRTPAVSTQGTGSAPRSIVPQPGSAAASKVNAGPTAAGVPAQPPQGTDPELWSVLTQDERTYFAKLGAMGPLTYGRVLSGQMQPASPSARGGRLDVKA